MIAGVGIATVPGMSRSDFSCLALLDTSRRNELSSVEVYKACSALANNGVRHEAESSLHPFAIELLNARRESRAGRLTEALKNLQNKNLDSPLLNGDRLFLLGTIAHKKGATDQAESLISDASREFASAMDSHRELRANINRLICTADLTSVTVGSLVALEKQAKREGHHDLVAAVARTRAFELLRQARSAEALEATLIALEGYSLDGCPEDAAVTEMLAAIIEVLQGNFEKARVHRGRVLLSGGKVEAYLQTYETLSANHVPKFKTQHALSGMPWKKLIFKAQSVGGRIITRLRQGPADRDELISHIWGDTALDPSYNSRLYTAINATRKAGIAEIYFDGSFYRIK